MCLYLRTRVNKCSPVQKTRSVQLHRVSAINTGERMQESTGREIFVFIYDFDTRLEANFRLPVSVESVYFIGRNNLQFVPKNKLLLSAIDK